MERQKTGSPSSLAVRVSMGVVVALAITSCSAQEGSTTAPDAVVRATSPVGLHATLNKKIRHYRVQVPVRLAAGRASNSRRETEAGAAAFELSSAGSRFSRIPSGPLFDEVANDSLDLVATAVVGLETNGATNTFTFGMNSNGEVKSAYYSKLQMLEDVNTGRRVVSAQGTTVYDATTSDSVNLSHLISQYPSYEIFNSCTYLGALTASATLRVKNLSTNAVFNFGPVITGDSRQRVRSCFPAPGPQCIQADGCTLDGGDGGGPPGSGAEVTGTVYYPPSVEMPGYHLTCLETDCYQDDGTTYLGTDTSKPGDGCWFDPN